ncbi:hypothetical protein NFI96_017673 [Prochilodus magdalenae]|nr:hypothetical protein NFI96_017673 [Prochilodus magdalenae]
MIGLAVVPARLARPFPGPESEHIWDIMSCSIHQCHFAPQTVQELTDALVQVWEEIPQETIRHLIRSMPRRCREVIQARGGHTQY